MSDTANPTVCEALAGGPRQDDAVTPIRQGQGRVLGHEYATTDARVKAALGL